MLAAVKQMSDLYAETGFTKEIVIYEKEGGEYVLNFTYRPDFERFKYFCYYLAYPSQGMQVWWMRGYWGLNDNSTEWGKKLMLYPSVEKGRALLGVAEGSSYTFEFNVQGREAFRVYPRFGAYEKLEFEESNLREVARIKSNAVSETVLKNRQRSWGVIGFLILMFLTFLMLLSRG